MNYSFHHTEWDLSSFSLTNNDYKTLYLYVTSLCVCELPLCTQPKRQHRKYLFLIHFNIVFGSVSFDLSCTQIFGPMPISLSLITKQYLCEFHWLFFCACYFKQTKLNNVLKSCYRDTNTKCKAEMLLLIVQRTSNYLFSICYFLKLSRKCLSQSQAIIVCRNNNNGAVEIHKSMQML